MTTKTCSKCNIEKDLEIDFYKDKTAFSGYKSQCKTCEIERAKKYSKDHYENNKEIILDRVNLYYDKNTDNILEKKKTYYVENREQKIIQSNINQEKYIKTLKGRFVHWRAGALSRHIEWKLSFEDICKIPLICFYTGDILVLEKNKINTISIERIDSTIGYTVENTVFCCSKVNWMKRNMSLNIFLDFCKKIAIHHS